MTKQIQLLWLGLLLSGSSCNHFTDQQPMPDSGPPPVSVQALTQQYPQAQDIQFITLANNQLWQANFTQQKHQYRALTSPTQLLTADQLSDGTLPDSLTRLLNQTVVGGGTFSAPHQRDYDWFRSQGTVGQALLVFADYAWQQQIYTAQWTITSLTTGKVIYQVELLPSRQSEYQTKTLTDLPELLQAALRDQGLQFTLAVIQVDAFNKRRYTLSVQQPSVPLQDQYWQLTYDDAGQLLAATNPATATFFQQLSELPPFIQQYMQRPDLAGFSPSPGANALSRHIYGSMSTYQVSMQKDKQVWLLTFSDNSQLISRSFLTYGSF